MLKSIAGVLFGSADDRAMKTRWTTVAAINALEPELAALPDDALRRKADELKRLASEGTSLDTLLVPAFALVREAAKRTLGQRHYDVQLIGGMALHEAAIAEMRTGEGKTLVATLAAFLNALDGRGVHVVTVNDYLARRDRELMGKVHEFLGLKVGLIVPEMSDVDRAFAYSCDITYGTNNEFGFDHLRDNLKFSRIDMVQRPFNFAIVDEVDSILIDEARTPLVISGPAEDFGAYYQAVDRFVARLERVAVEIDEKERTVVLTDGALDRIEGRMRETGLLRNGSGLFDPANALLTHHVNAALRAHFLFQRDRHYIVQDGEVVIVDEFTGRTLAGRRFNEGIHQAIEAKERVAIQPENQTVASVTYQSFFRQYRKLSGMTGTAATEADEFASVYGLPVVSIPTHKPIVRRDLNDEIYRTEAEKLSAIIAEIQKAHARLQPILVGTASIEKSEALAERLSAAGFERIDFGQTAPLRPTYDAADANRPARRFAVLNAKVHEHEASIIAQAGVPGAITIATNMAGRGTDIQLGGNLEMRVAEYLPGGDSADDRATAGSTAIADQVRRFAAKALEVGGLYVIGTERHESRRIDNQLRGRTGRQGDPGCSKFFLALTDDVLRLFGNIGKLADELDLGQGEAISHPMINRTVQRAQTKLEAHHFETRKQIVRYDEVVNQQRLAVLMERAVILDSDDVRATIDNMRGEWIELLLARHIPARTYPEQWNAAGLAADLARCLHLNLPVEQWIAEDGITEPSLRARIGDAADRSYHELATAGGQEHKLGVEKRFLLMILDFVWREHLEALDHLKQVVGWRAIGQRDPLAEFSTEATVAFEAAIDRWKELVTLEVMRPQKAAA